MFVGRKKNEHVCVATKPEAGSCSLVWVSSVDSVVHSMANGQWEGHDDRRRIRREGNQTYKKGPQEP